MNTDDQWEFTREESIKSVYSALWEMFPGRQIPNTQESRDTIAAVVGRCVEDCVDKYINNHYTTFFSDPVYDKETGVLSVTVGIKEKE